MTDDLKDFIDRASANLADHIDDPQPGMKCLDCGRVIVELEGDDGTTWVGCVDCEVRNAHDWAVATTVTRQ